MAEFSTRKITPTDAMKIPAVNENLANPSGYVEADELKDYMIAGLAESADVVDADTGIRGTDDGYDDTSTSYAKGDPCIYQNVVYVCKDPITAPAGDFDPTKWDESSLATLMAGVNTNAEAISSLIKVSCQYEELTFSSGKASKDYASVLSSLGWTTLLTAFWNYSSSTVNSVAPKGIALSSTTVEFVATGNGLDGTRGVNVLLVGY